MHKAIIKTIAAAEIDFWCKSATDHEKFSQQGLFWFLLRILFSNVNKKKLIAALAYPFRELAQSRLADNL